MRVAIIHDVFIEFGGAERVLMVLLDIYPAADVYIPLLSIAGRNEIEKKTHGKIITSLFNLIPFAHTASSLFKPFLYFYWESLDLSSYDLVISSSHSFSSKSVITLPETLHISYIHTTPRYLYGEFNEMRTVQTWPFRFFFVPVLSWLRRKDFVAAQRPDVLIANSQTVARRIKKYYQRDSVVIYPPVFLSREVPRDRKKEYYLCVSRLVKQKGVELAVRTCSQHNLQLVVVGAGPQERYLRSIAGPTIVFKGYVDDRTLDRMYVHAKALLYCSIQEDFGMVPVEAMAHGVPVVAYKSGGTIETVLHKKTGILFDQYTIDGLKDAIDTIGRLTIDPRDCIRQAARFSNKRFVTKIKEIIRSYR